MSATVVTADEFTKIVEEKFKSFPTIDAAAKALGISRQHYYDIVNGYGRRPGPKLLRAMGYRRVTTYTYEPIPE